MYDVAFEGLIKMWSADAGRPVRKVPNRNTRLFADHAVPCLQRPASETGSTGSDSWRKNISQITEMSVENLNRFMSELELSKSQKLIGEQVLKEIRARLGFLVDVGLDYLTLAQRDRNTFGWGSTEK